MHFIIALLSTIPFILTLFLLIFAAMWLQRYYPNTPMQQLARIVYTEKGTTDITIMKGCSSLHTILSRKESCVNTTTANKIELPTAQGFAVYESVALRDQLVPLGFFSQYRLVKILDAEGNVQYQAANDFVDSLMNIMMQFWGKRSDVIVPLLATAGGTTYTVTISDTGPTQNEN